MAYLVEFHPITKILLTLRKITKKITKNFQLPKSPKNREILPKVIKITKSGHTVAGYKFSASTPKKRISFPTAQNFLIFDKNSLH